MISVAAGNAAVVSTEAKVDQVSVQNKPILTTPMAKTILRQQDAQRPNAPSTSSFAKRAWLRGGRSLLGVEVAVFGWALLILPFLEPWSIDVLVESGFLSPLLQPFSQITTLARAAIAMCAFLLIPKLGEDAKMVIFPCLFSAGMLAAITLNGDLAFSTISLPIQYLGLTVLLFYLHKKNPWRLFRALMVSFVSVFFLAVFSVFLFGGLVPSATAAGVIYSFGGKNSLFVTLAPFIVLVGMWGFASKGKASWAPCAIAAVLAIMASIVESSGSLTCFALAFVSLVPVKGKYAIQLAKPTVLLVAIVVIFFGTVLSSFITEATDWLFSLLGRESSFTNRDILWGQAIQLFLASPVIGSGADVIYTMSFMSGEVETSIAHCFYLDIAAKYGLMALLPFFIDVVWLVRFTNKRRKLSKFAPAIALFLIVLFHSCYDDLLLYFYAIVRFLTLLPQSEPRQALATKDGEADDF